MPKTKISEFSSTPANNTDIDSINISEGCAPSGINDAIRELMAQLKDFQTGAVGDSFNGPVGSTTASTGAFTTLSASSTVTLSGGTANGVTYLNGSKVVTSGSALTFDGTALGVGISGTGGLPIKFVTDATANGRSWGIRNGYTNSGDFVILSSSTNNDTLNTVQVQIQRDGTFVWTPAGTEQMRLTSTGLGIGTSSPTDKLTVAGNAVLVGDNAALFVKNAAGNFAGTFRTSRAYTGGVGSYNDLAIATYGVMNFFTNNTATPAATLDSSGNLGLGVTPSAWTAAYRAFDFGGYGNLFSNSTDKEVALTYNAAVVSGTGWTYKNTNQASLYNQQNGKHIWQTAASGTAGTSISWTTPMTLDASGNLLVGTTSAGGTERLNVTKDVAGTEIVRFYPTHATDPYGLLIFYSNANPNGTANEFLGCYSSSSTKRMTVQSNGGIANYSGNNVNLSDRREKTNFAPASSYLDKICAIPVQTFNYIDQNLEQDGGLTLGVVAQDVQAVAPELVLESNWASKDEEPKMRLSIYQTDLQYALMKCIQEQQAIINSLKARLDAANL